MTKITPYKKKILQQTKPGFVLQNIERHHLLTLRPILQFLTGIKSVCSCACVRVHACVCERNVHVCMCAKTSVRF